jgi:hypothetical protein
MVKGKFPFLKFLPLLCLVFLLPIAQAGIGITGTLGGQSSVHFKGPAFGYTLGLYSKVDDQTWVGIQSGQGVAGQASAIPVLGAAYLRLPIGRIVMPVATGGMGYAFGSRRKGFLWRAGGLFDIRNGRHSSLLIGTEYEGLDGHGGLIGRAGLLLEF